jgi:hypothetical protein
VGTSTRKDFVPDLRAIFATPAREQALGSASAMAERWRGKGHPKAAEQIEEYLCRPVSRRAIGSVCAPPAVWRG